MEHKLPRHLVIRPPSTLALSATSAFLSATAPCRRFIVVVAGQHLPAFFLNPFVRRGCVVFHPQRSSVWQGSCTRGFAGAVENKAL
jgi:hypothetical protein